MLQLEAFYGLNLSLDVVDITCPAIELVGLGMLVVVEGGDAMR